MVPMTLRAGSRSWLIRGLLVMVVGLVLWLVVSSVFVYRSTRRPHPWFAEPAPAVPWGVFESHRLKTRDGQRLGAWLVRGKEEAPSVLLLHGHRGSRKKCVDRAAILAEAGCTVLLISLRAHGDSTGEFNDIGYSARHDVIAAIDFLERHRPGKPIVVQGSSMGAAAAVFASRELAGRVRGYVLECPYKDLKTAVWNRIENALPPVLAWIAYEGLLIVAPLFLPELENISVAAAIEGIPSDVPVLILAGESDRLARPEEAVVLFDQVRSHGTLMIFQGAGHVRLRFTDPERYRQAVLGLVQSVQR
jgi:pimeloyl-ACP methyl ester carboxylesterase